MRTIDADALIKWINESRCADCPDRKEDRCAACQWDDIIMSIETAPTVATDTNVPCKWISVKDRLPEGECLAFSNKFKEMIIGYLYEDKESESHWSAENDEVVMYEVTHWMPLPKSPEEEN